MNNKKFIVIFIVLLLLIFESISFIYFRFISNDLNNLTFYSEKRKGNLSYRYFENVGLVLPNIENKKDLIVTHYTKEFTDKFIFRDILGLGFGFPDDGLDDRKFKAVAIGDSFTRGVGSIDNLKNGWVELIEKKNKDIDIINLGHLGAGINDQKYGYDKLKKFINHNVIIYSSISTEDYRDNLSDTHYSYYVEKVYKKSGNKEAQKLINDLQIRHGYKYHLEYLLKNKFKSYSIYFVFKIADYLINKKILPTYKFKYVIPEDETRLKIVDDELFELSKNKEYYKIVCNEKYCYQDINEKIITEAILDKIILNFANKINQFHEESLKDSKEFIFVLLSNAGHFYPNQTPYDHSKLDEKLIELLDPRIKVVNIGKKLSEINNRKKGRTYFYKYDGHYNIEGYKAVSDIMSKELKIILDSKK